MDFLASNIFYFGMAGSVLFLFLIILMGASGLFKSVRDDEGNFKKERNFKSILAFSIFIGFIVGLFFYSNYTLISHDSEYDNIWIIFINTFAIYTIIQLFDLIVLDYLIIVKWHPGFLKLPDTDYYNKMAKHWFGFKRGMIIGPIPCFLISLISFWLF